MDRNTLGKRVGTYIALALYLAFLLIPALWLLTAAFKTPAEIASSQQPWLPSSLYLENFVTAFAEQPILQALINSIVVSGSAAVITIALSVAAAYFLARRRGLLSSAALGWIVVSQLFPFILILIPLFLLMINMGLYNTHLGLIAVYVVWSMPFAIWMLRSYVASIPIELEHAAAIDGANQAQILTRIITPLLLPGCIAAGVFAFVSAWNEFFFALVMLRDERLYTLSLMVVRFIGEDGAVRLGPLAAVAIIATIPSLIFFAFMQRHLVGGMVGGAVKG